PAFYQLVLYPTEASANLNKLYVTVAKNRAYAEQGRAKTNMLADSAKSFFIKDSLLSHFYNKVMEKGRWDHIMDQTHIGYTYWQEPPYNNMPKTDVITIPKKADMGVTVQGSDKWYPQNKKELKFPDFDGYNRQKYSLEIFNRRESTFSFKIQKSKSWIKVSQVSGKIKLQKKITVSINWEQVPQGKSKAFIIIHGTKEQKVKVGFDIHNQPLSVAKNQLSAAFLEGNGVISV